MYRRQYRAAVLLAVTLGFQACGSNPPAPEPPPKPLSLMLAASADINPDLNGRPSPVAMAIFQLKSPDRFAKADFFVLFEPDPPSLVTDMVSREQMMIQPGEQRTILVELGVETRYLAVAVAYRDIEQATWRTLVPVDRDTGKKGMWGKEKDLTAGSILLDSQSVTLTLEAH